MNYEERLFRQSTGYGCPVTLGLTVTQMVVMGIALASSAASAVATAQAQKANAAAQEASQVQQVNASNAVADQQAGQLRQQEAQDNESRARSDQQATQANKAASATALTSAGEAGVTGASVDALMGEYNMQMGQYKDATNRQGQLNRVGIENQLGALQEQTKFSNLQINAPVAQPQYGAIGLQFASNALGTYHAYNPDAFARKP
jgi:hypothetical protein